MLSSCKVFFLVALVFPSATSGFVLPKHQWQQAAMSLKSAVQPDPSSGSSSNKGLTNINPDEILSKLSEIDLELPDLDFNVIKSNLLEGEVGTRGEVYVAAQFGLLLFIAGGGIPIVGGLLMTLLGPCLMVAGIAALGLSIKDLGNSLSPWIIPSPDGDLIEDGIYSKLRHPQYAGLLATMAGFSIVTGSASRLLLTAVLYYVLGEMANLEEEELIEKYPDDYEFYKERVVGKFFPVEVIQKQLPWNNEL